MFYWWCYEQCSVHIGGTSGSVGELVEMSIHKRIVRNYMICQDLLKKTIFPILSSLTGDCEVKGSFQNYF